MSNDIPATLLEWNNPLRAEQRMISAMLQSVDALWEVVDVLPLDHLIEPRHETIAKAIRYLAESEMPTDVIAVTDELTRRGEINHIGGAPYLHRLYGEAPTHTNAGFYAEIVRAEVERRRLGVAGETIRDMAADQTITPRDRAEKARALVDDALNLQVLNFVDPAEQLQLDLERVGHEQPGHDTPWPGLTNIIGGFQPDNLYVLGARPSIGKTAVALQMATALEAHGVVIFFSLEMSRKQMNYRLMAQNTGVALRQFTHPRGPLLPEFRERVETWVATPPHRIIIDDDSGLTISDIYQRVRTLSRKFNIAGVIIDHMQIMAPSDSSLNRTQQISEISMRLKWLAKAFHVPVIALSQLNRDSEKRADPTPGLHDLRESGTIEQDADVVIMLHRDKSLDAVGNPIDDTFEFHIVKNRQGEVRELDLRWDGAFVSTY